MNIARVSFELVPVQPTSTGVRVRITMSYKCRVSEKLPCYDIIVELSDATNVQLSYLARDRARRS